MIRSIFACLSGKGSHKEVKVEPMEVTKSVYRNELSKKEAACQRVKKTVRFAESEPTILGEEKRRCGEELGEKEGIRVKIKLSKEEAVRLLGKCNGGVLQFKDVARELVFIPVNRVSIL
ncbi:hypothetical protein RJT34_02804 [Clitoria ternatea]|uniref:DUF7890 domain-containing protein n=1 Tax=Clitoria ternatea TaxID=43366 RepID=A0AAN9KJL5_CLITE